MDHFSLRKGLCFLENEPSNENEGAKTNDVIEVTLGKADPEILLTVGEAEVLDEVSALQDDELAVGVDAEVLDVLGVDVARGFNRVRKQQVQLPLDQVVVLVDEPQAALLQCHIARQVYIPYSLLGYLYRLALSGPSRRRRSYFP